MPVVLGWKSVASAETVIVPFTDAPSAGLVSISVGAVVSLFGLIESTRLGVVELLVATSIARAEMFTTCPAYGLLSHATQYGYVESLAMSQSFKRNSTRSTPLGSLAFA